MPPSAQVSARLRPSRPTTRSAIGELGGPEAGRHHDDVDGVLPAVGRDDRGGRDPGDRVGDEVDVVGGESGVVGVGPQDPLAPDAIAGRRLRAQRGVLDPLVDVDDRGLLGRRGQPRLPGERRDVALVRPVGGGPVEAGECREVAQRGPLGPRVGPVVAGDHPRGGALVDVEVGGHLLHLGHDLDRRGAGADHRDPPAGQVDGVVPRRGVEQRATEALDALDLREARRGEAAGRRDERPGGDLAGRRTDLPALRGVVPGGVLELGAEDGARGDAVLLGDAAQVGLDLGLRGVRRRPVGVAGEGERVELAGDVAAGSGVGVVAPGAADVVGLLDHDVVGLAGLGELDRSAEPGETGPDDQVVDVRREGRCGHGVTLAAPRPPWVGDDPGVSRW